MVSLSLRVLHPSQQIKICLPIYSSLSVVCLFHNASNWFFVIPPCLLLSCYCQLVIACCLVIVVLLLSPCYCCLIIIALLVLPCYCHLVIVALFSSPSQICVDVSKWCQSQGRHGQSLLQVIMEQFYGTFLLDNYPMVRVACRQAIAQLSITFWDVVPTNFIRSLLNRKLYCKGEVTRHKGADNPCLSFALLF